MPKSRKRRRTARTCPTRQTGRARPRRLLPYPGAAEKRLRHLPQSGRRRARRHRARRRKARQRLLGHAKMADRQVGGAPRRQAARARHGGRAQGAVAARLGAAPSRRRPLHRQAAAQDPGGRKADAGDAARAARQHQEGAGRVAQAAAGEAHDPQAARAASTGSIRARKICAPANGAISAPLLHARRRRSTSATCSISSGTSRSSNQHTCVRGGRCWRARIGAAVHRRARRRP